MRFILLSDSIQLAAAAPLRRLSMLVCLLWIGVFLAAPTEAADICGHPIAGRIEILRDGRRVGTVDITVAASVQEHELGLMHCPALAHGTGMYFIYPDARQRIFWMKNTLIELAIIFISSGGRIAAIAHGEPGSLAYIYSPEDIVSVLEINFAESRELNAGDQVRWVDGSRTTP